MNSTVKCRRGWHGVALTALDEERRDIAETYLGRIGFCVISGVRWA